ncbi:MAG TPA: zinc dependent phospholipase C family protein [Bryobacteraceae bacterium]|nr:zinc dependent phospholipase C family protein [Bryobacteraceae bacterium]
MLSSSVSYGYTVLTHEAIIDSVWDNALQKQLLKRFPGATPEDLQEAHAYVYGGCIIQDMGYYPFSSRLFSDLTHYVRSGDFIETLIRESQTLDEFAFALGALEHYAADTEGHRLGTNRAVPMLYPELKRKYGNNVTYWDNPVAHIRTEFGFDVLQVAMERYAPDRYRSFIGFKVSRDVLERAFLDTYGIEMKDVFGNVTLALGSYRWAIRSILPGMTRVAWSLRKNEIRKEIPGITRKKFLYNLSRSSYEKEWGKDYHKPALGTRILAFLFRFLPGGGPFTALRIRTPTPEVEKLFMASFNATVDRYKALLAEVDSNAVLPNENFDSGEQTIEGKYVGADEAYAKLVGKLAERHFAGITPDLRQNILAYYKDLRPVVPAKASNKERRTLTTTLAQLERLRATPEAVAVPEAR